MSSNLKPCPALSALIAIVGLLALTLCSCRPQQPNAVSTPQPATVSTPRQPGTVNTLADFEASSFYQTYRLTRGDGWKLSDGGYNNTYNVGRVPDITFEAVTRGNDVQGLGVVFYKRDTLGGDDLTFIRDLLGSLDSAVKPDAKLETYIKTDAEKNVFQVADAAPRDFGKFKVYAGKVGGQQHVSIRRAAQR